MNFSKYNKGLRFYATLYQINADVFNTESFVDIYAKDKELKIYYNKLYDNYIIKLLTENVYYYNTIIEVFNNSSCICYVYKFNSNNPIDIITINCLDNNSNLLIDKTFYIEVCIHWKNYLDNTFINLTDTCYNNQTKKARSDTSLYYYFII